MAKELHWTAYLPEAGDDIRERGDRIAEYDRQIASLIRSRDLAEQMAEREASKNWSADEIEAAKAVASSLKGE